MFVTGVEYPVFPLSAPTVSTEHRQLAKVIKSLRYAACCSQISSEKWGELAKFVGWTTKSIGWRSSAKPLATGPWWWGEIMGTLSRLRLYWDQRVTERHSSYQGLSAKSFNRITLP